MPGELDEATVAALATRLVGEGRVLAVSREGAGWDHVAWRVDTPDGPWIIRAASDATAEERALDVRREVAVMTLVRRRLGAWVADARVLDEARGALAHRRVPGVPAHELIARRGLDQAAVAALAGRLGRFVRSVGALDPALLDEPVPLDEDGHDVWLAGLPAFVAVFEHLLTAPALDAVAAFVSSPPPPGPAAAERVLQHNDLGAEHVLVDASTWSITGIIDWSDAAVVDPAADLGRLLRDLGAGALPPLLDGFGASGDWRSALAERAWFHARCLTLEDLAYAVEHRPDLVELELANLRRLLPPAD